MRVQACSAAAACSPAVRSKSECGAPVAQLRSDGATKVFTVGFCFGGGYSWRQSADTPGLAGCIGFYGRPQPALEVADRMQAPLLMLMAGADAHIPVEDTRAVKEAASVEADFVVFGRRDVGSDALGCRLLHVRHELEGVGPVRRLCGAPE